jgi:hypothetical protein
MLFIIFMLNILSFAVSLNNEIKIINMDFINKKRNFYIIITNDVDRNKVLMHDIKVSKNSAIFIPKNYYSKKDLAEIYEDDIPDKKFLTKDPLIFDTNGFIGSSYELYKIILNNNN